MSQQSSMEKTDAKQRHSGAPEVARRLDRSVVFVGSACLAILTGLCLLDSAALRLGFGALFAAGAAYLLLGPAMTVTLGLLSAWMSSRS
jgi:hypothetical protein